MEERDMSQDWIVDLAGTLISEIFYTMSRISLWLIPEIPALEALDSMESVLGVASSEHCGMRMQMRSSYSLFERLARNMIGDAPEDRQEVEEYATEMFNIVCGRFISELCVAMKCCGRFQPTTYERSPDVTDLLGGGSNSIYFKSDEDEVAVFSWRMMTDDDKKEAINA